MRLEFGIGACGILFGMTPKDVVSALGMPDKINVCEDDEIYGQTYIYNRDMLMVWFEREKDEVMKLIKSAGCSRFTENDGPTEETVFFDDIAAWFNFEFGKLSYVELGVFFNETTGEEIWSFGE